MNLHEYQSKGLFAQYVIPIPRGRVADSPEAAMAAAKEPGGSLWVVKAQVHAGGRGKAGGVKVVKDLDAVRAVAGGKGTPGVKFEALEAAGITTVHSPAEMGSAIAKRLTGKSRKTARAKRRPAKSSVKTRRSKITARRRVRRPK
ncbi:MAG TPA: ATP-grasp domain-containing protein [Steroidobacteraceae bacterium]|jgi:hypothetical protein|nr:ATP-grasp domain-containing protein [Steroidobacteraceae bacterium]